ncbi:MAG: beta-ketoacyl-[acyl-carrier-protein] synthase family protein [Chitinispirillales bacterium]|jgi:3-oxoacyl-[acyl-carrier-protein] synthase II|nr:beta-ketoacyl-[acyl-carrier-protein] synthase family protein [Chitinispirillales bacterium]
MPKRVVVSGIGLITPIGTGKDKFWAAAKKGTNGVLPIVSFDTTDYRSKTGGEVKDFTANDYLRDEEINSMGKAGQFAVAAARIALDDAKLIVKDVNPYRLGVSMGTTMGEPQVIQHILARHSKDQRLITKLEKNEARKYPANTIPANVSRFIGAKGQTMLIPTACAAGNYALGYAMDLIRMGRLDYAVAGGSDPFASIAFCGFNRLLATTMDVCRPFDLNRDGMAVAEGAAVLVMETLDNALDRGAQIYGEVLGYGLGCDAYDMTAPHPEGNGGILAMERAISHSKINKKDVSYICAHGTGTPANDASETKIAKYVFGEDAYKIPMSSLKSMMGHTMGAASAIEAAASLLMMKNNTILPTINYENPDPECDLDYVPNIAREAELDIIISNAYAFGGNTSAIVLKKFRGE